MVTEPAREPAPATITWTGSNLAEIRQIAPGARRWPRPESILLVLPTPAGERTLPAGSIVYLEDGEVRGYSSAALDMGLDRLLEAARDN